METQGIGNLQGNKGKSYQILVQVSLKWEFISLLQTFEDTIKLLYKNNSFWNLYLGFLECDFLFKGIPLVFLNTF